VTEFADSLTEGFLNLYAIGGALWVQQATGATFRGLEMNESGGYELMSGSTDFKDDVNLAALKVDFPTGVPMKTAIIFRQPFPQIIYQLTEDTNAKNPVNPIVTMKLELKVH
jgi:hypothetical protein